MRHLVLVLLVPLLAGCGVRHAPLDDGGGGPSITPTVRHEVRDAFFREPPRCAIVLPTLGEPPGPFTARAIEAALARQLTGRLPRVIGPKERTDKARGLGVAVRTADGRATLARRTDCHHVVVPRPADTSTVHAGVWSRVRLGLDVSLWRVGADTPLWRARHTATRSEGGLPTSPLSAVVSAASASVNAADPAVHRSVLADAARRIVRTLPDTRGL